MSLDPAEVHLRQVLHAAGERQQLVDPNDFVQVALRDPAYRGRWQVDPSTGLPTNADALAAELADASPHLVAGMGQRLRRAGRVEAVPPLQLPDDGGQPAFQGSADGGARGTAGPPKGPDMNDLIRSGPRGRGL